MRRSIRSFNNFSPTPRVTPGHTGLFKCPPPGNNCVQMPHSIFLCETQEKATVTFHILTSFKSYAMLFARETELFIFTLDTSIFKYTTIAFRRIDLPHSNSPLLGQGTTVKYPGGCFNFELIGP